MAVKVQKPWIQVICGFSPDCALRLRHRDAASPPPQVQMPFDLKAYQVLIWALEWAFEMPMCVLHREDDIPTMRGRVQRSRTHLQHGHCQQTASRAVCAAAR